MNYSNYNIIQAETYTTEDAQIKAFEEQLGTAVMNSNGYLSVMFGKSSIITFQNKSYFALSKIKKA